MRISDWSSDVCSSDLPPSASILWVAGWGSGQVPLQKIALSRFLEQTLSRCWNSTVRAPKLPRSEEGAKEGAKEGDRKSVVEGKSVSVRVDLGGRRIIKKKTQNKQSLMDYDYRTNMEKN